MRRLSLPLALLTSLAAGLVATGCSLADDGIAEEVTGDVVFSIYEDERAGAADGARRLGVATVDVYSCLLPLAVQYSAGTAGRQRASHAALRLEVRGIQKVRYCPTAIGPASASVDLGVADGTYTLELLHRGQRDMYEVTIAGRAIGVETINASVSCYVAELRWLGGGHQCAREDM
jgi:hypothetical protein